MMSSSQAAQQEGECKADDEGLQMVLNRLKALEQENDGPERRELLRRRKKQLKEILSQHKEGSQLPALQKRFEQEFHERTKLEAEMISLRKNHDAAVKSNTQVQSELQAKALLAEKLQELARSLQAQNKQIKEDDLQKRQNMLADFQSAIDDIKSRVTESHKMQEDTLREKQAVQLRLQGAIDMQTALEKSYEAKEKEVALKLELAAARLQQAEAEAQRYEKAAQSYRQQYEGAADIVAEMGQKYQSFEQGIQQNMEAFKLMKEESGKQAQLNTQMAKILKKRDKEYAQLQNELAGAQAKAVQLAVENERLKQQKGGDATAGAQLDRLQAQNGMLQKVSRKLQEEVRLLRMGHSVPEGNGTSEQSMPEGDGTREHSLDNLQQGPSDEKSPSELPLQA
ncbi:g10332 [Coccomyxa viridis]|uniref:G10332 protein n=1 Tax=Coccomyxa viridis TaxID=1274662 RepID=A0ABP1G5H7_9CHLO